VIRTLIPTECQACDLEADVTLKGFCPRCGRGPAEPSDERVLIPHGEPVTVVGRDEQRFFRRLTRPARQTIPVNGAVKPASRSASLRRGNSGRPLLIPALEWPVLYRRVVKALRRNGDEETWLRVAQYIRNELSDEHPEWESFDEKTVARYCKRDGLPHPKRLVIDS